MNYLSLSELATINIRALLGVNRESIEKLSRDTGISSSTIKRRLDNKQPFTLDEIEKISKHFQLKPSDIFSAKIKSFVDRAPDLADAHVN